MAFKATPMQKLAIETDGGVLVSAAAGSGKTAVLVERVMRKLTDPENPISADRLLIVTFTNAAAAEMRSRIEKRLYEECLKNPDDIGLLRQKHLISSADICTIDSFCINLVRENFEKCGVQPDFKVGDASSALALRSRAADTVIAEQLEKASAPFKKLLDLTDCEYDEKKLIALIESIYDYSLQLPFPKSFINSLKAPYEQEFEKGHPWYDEAFSAAKGELETAQKYTAQLAEAAVYVEKNSDKCVSYADNVSLLLSDLCAECERLDHKSFSAMLEGANIPRIPSVGKGECDELFKKTKKKISDIISAVKALFPPLNSIKEQIAELFPAVSLLCELIERYGELLISESRKENILTFADTEQMALSLLCMQDETGVHLREEAAAIAEKYDEVLVDEFQDVNDLQNMLFYVLSKHEKRLFSVGDVKQSIYGFRGSNPKNFLSKKNSYIPILSADKSDPKKIILSDNFRSRAGVCGYINFFFSLFMGGQGSILYNEEERLNAAAIFPESDAPAAELLICKKDEEASDDSSLKGEAQCIAQYIKKAMDEGCIIRGSDGNLRPAEYSDFVILLGAMQNKASVIAEELSGYRIPVAFSPESYINTTEISVFTSLLQVIDNPRLDIPLLTVLMSPIFGFTAEDIALIRANHKKGDLFTSVTFAAENGDIYAKEFFTRLHAMRRDAAMLPLERLISKLLDTTDYLNIVSAMPHGKTRRSNLLRLPVFAAQYTASSRGSLSGFVNFLHSLPEKSFRGNSGSEEGVRIMSMHASKGLQFPICIAANLSSRINNADSVSRILFTEKFGLTFKYYDESTDSDINTIGHILTARHTYTETIDERLRLLYVAMTRAEDRLVLVSSNKELESALNRAAAGITQETPVISEYWLNKSSSMNDWVLACALLHPDGEVLRRMCDIPVSPITDSSRLKISFFTAKAAQNDTGENELLPQSLDPELSKELQESLNYRYPFEELKKLQAKCSVSVIANKAESERFAFTERPSFMSDEGLSAAGRGTAMHHIMQFISLEGVPDIEEEILRLEDNQFITPAEAQCADRQALKRFFESPVFERIRNSADVHREMRFLTEIPASRLDPELDSRLKDTPVMVQGAVDLCFAEDNGIVVLDFKTDRTDNPQHLIEAYGEQLNIYSKACEKIFKKPVKQKLIYSFALSRVIELPQ